MVIFDEKFTISITFCPFFTKNPRFELIFVSKMSIFCQKSFISTTLWSFSMKNPRHRLIFIARLVTKDNSLSLYPCKSRVKLCKTEWNWVKISITQKGHQFILFVTNFWNRCNIRISPITWCYLPRDPNVKVLFQRG